MADLSWREAIIRVLGASPQPMHYTAISEAIGLQGLKKSVGATPAQTVNATISLSIKSEQGASPFQRVEAGRYALRALPQGPQVPPTQSVPEDPVETGLINAFGMYWSRASVRWESTPRLLGRQARASTAVDFCGQAGVYLLHDRRDVVYVGRTTEQPLGVRLQQHTQDRLNGRWERFSWFGVYSITEAGALDKTGMGTYNLQMLIFTMEALLIEGLEPPQNRKRGDGFKAVEFLQVEDPEIQRSQLMQLMDALKTKL